MDTDKDKNETSIPTKKENETSANSGLELAIDDSNDGLKDNKDVSSSKDTDNSLSVDTSDNGLSLDTIPEEMAQPAPTENIAPPVQETKEEPPITTEPEEPFIDGLPEPDIDDDNLAAPIDEILEIDQNDKKSKKKTLMAGVAIVALGLAVGGYFMLSSDDTPPQLTAPSSSTMPPQTTNQFADVNDDMPGFAPESNIENNITDDLSSMDFSAPPQPDLANDIDMSTETNLESFSNDDFAGNIDTAPQTIDEGTEIIEPVLDDIENITEEVSLNDSLPIPPIESENTAIPIEDNVLETTTEDMADIEIEPVNTEPPIEMPMDTAEQNEQITSDVFNFDDVPQIPDTEQAPNNMALIPPSMPSTDINNTTDTNDTVDTEIAPDLTPPPSLQTITKMTPVQTKAIPNTVDANTSTLAQGNLQAGDNDMRDSLKDMPAREALIRPLPKKYLIIEKSSSKTGARKASTKRAATALRQGHAGAALGILEKADRRNPGNKSIMMKQAIAYQQMGNNDFALKKYEEILRKDPTDLDALTNMLGLLRDTKPQLALNKLHELRNIYPENAGIAAQLAIAYAGLKHYKEALKNLDIAAGLDSPNAYYTFNKAVFLDHLGRKAEATEMYKQALKMHSNGMNGTQPIPIAAIRKRLHISY